jgi:hypothetical protein
MLRFQDIATPLSLCTQVNTSAAAPTPLKAFGKLGSHISKWLAKAFDAESRVGLGLEGIPGI